MDVLVKHVYMGGACVCGGEMSNKLSAVCDVRDAFAWWMSGDSGVWCGVVWVSYDACDF